MNTKTELNGIKNITVFRGDDNNTYSLSLIPEDLRLDLDEKIKNFNSYINDNYETHSIIGEGVDLQISIDDKDKDIKAFLICGNVDLRVIGLGIMVNFYDEVCRFWNENHIDKSYLSLPAKNKYGIKAINTFIDDGDENISKAVLFDDLSDDFRADLSEKIDRFILNKPDYKSVLVGDLSIELSISVDECTISAYAICRNTLDESNKSELVISRLGSVVKPDSFIAEVINAKERDWFYIKLLKDC